MLGIIHEKQSQPEVFCVAINLMDRFLCTCQIKKSQLQLLGAVCVLVASKVREPRSIPGSDLIKYTDDSITAEELKVSYINVFSKLAMKKVRSVCCYWVLGKFCRCFQKFIPWSVDDKCRSLKRECNKTLRGHMK